MVRLVLFFPLPKRAQGDCDVKWIIPGPLNLLTVVMQDSHLRFYKIPNFIEA